MQGRFLASRPFLGLWRECVRGPKGNRSASFQVVWGKQAPEALPPGKKAGKTLDRGRGCA